MTNIQNYDDALAFIHGRTKFKKIPTLKRMRRFLKELGNTTRKAQLSARYRHQWQGINRSNAAIALNGKWLDGRDFYLAVYCPL